MIFSWSSNKQYNTPQYTAFSSILEYCVLLLLLLFCIPSCYVTKSKTQYSVIFRCHKPVLRPYWEHILKYVISDFPMVITTIHSILPTSIPSCNVRKAFAPHKVLANNSFSPFHYSQMEQSEFQVSLDNLFTLQHAETSRKTTQKECQVSLDYWSLSSWKYWDLHLAFQTSKHNIRATIFAFDSPSHTSTQD